jgi:hypothetical protein
MALVVLVDWDVRSVLRLQGRGNGLRVRRLLHMDRMRMPGQSIGRGHRDCAQQGRDGAHRLGCFTSVVVARSRHGQGSGQGSGTPDKPADKLAAGALLYSDTRLCRVEPGNVAGARRLRPVPRADRYLRPVAGSLRHARVSRVARRCRDRMADRRGDPRGRSARRRVSCRGWRLPWSP